MKFLSYRECIDTGQTIILHRNKLGFVAKFQLKTSLRYSLKVYCLMRTSELDKKKSQDTDPGVESVPQCKSGAVSLWKPREYSRDQ